jgi:cytochrome P450
LRVDAEGVPGFWAVTTHADVLEVERHPEVFTNAPMPVMTRLSQSAATETPPVKTLIQMDGEEHRLHHAVVSEWFKPGGVRKLSHRINELAVSSVDHMSALGGQCDFMADIAAHYPLQVILALLGLPEQDYPRMLQLTQELFGAEDPEIARVTQDSSILEVVVDFLQYFSGLTADRRACPRMDLSSVIAGASINGEPLPDTDTFGYYLIIATAGHDTTSNVIGGALLALLEYPDQLDRLKADPTLMPQAADEFVRYVAPVKHFLRTCTTRYTIRDVTFERGDRVLLSFASATRDEDVFANAQMLDVTRSGDSNHLGFGFGRHFCLGAHLARLEIRSFYTELLSRLEHIELSADPTWVRANFVQGPKSIPVSYAIR